MKSIRQQRLEAEEKNRNWYIKERAKIEDYYFQHPIKNFFLINGGRLLLIGGLILFFVLVVI